MRSQRAPGAPRADRCDNRAEARFISIFIGDDAMRPAARHLGRRAFISGTALAVGNLTLGSVARRQGWAQTPTPAVITPDRMRPGIPYGVQSGDVSRERVVVWSRSDRPAQMVVEYATTDSFKNARRVVGSAALPDSDFTARVNLTG